MDFNGTFNKAVLHSDKPVKKQSLHNNISNTNKPKHSNNVAHYLRVGSLAGD